MNTSQTKSSVTNKTDKDQLKNLGEFSSVPVRAVGETLAVLQIKNNELMRLYLEQIERNNEMLSLIEKQQRVINILVSKVELKSKTDLAKQNTNGNSQPMFFDQLLNAVIKLYGEKRLSMPTMVAQTKFILSVYNLTTGCTPEELFEKNGLNKTTGVRYAQFFQQNNLMELLIHNNIPHYRITDDGKNFVEGNFQN